MIRPLRLLAPGLPLCLSAAAALAQPAWDDPHDRDRSRREAAPAAEGRVEVARFRADAPAAAALRSGAIAVVAMPGGTAGESPRQEATYQAAVESALIGAGYAAGNADAPQIAEVRITRSELRPAEAKRKPVSGEMSVGLSNRGSMMGLGLYIDATKPRKALVSTLLETRIRDRASGTVLWEGRAMLGTRDGDAKWDDDAIAARLSRALFAGFPGAVGETSEKR